MKTLENILSRPFSSVTCCDFNAHGIECECDGPLESENDRRSRLFPDLLAALKELTAQIDYDYPAHSGFWDTKPGQELLKGFNMATKAIAKAEGKNK